MGVSPQTVAFWPSTTSLHMLNTVKTIAEKENQIRCRRRRLIEEEKLNLMLQETMSGKERQIQRCRRRITLDIHIGGRWRDSAFFGRNILGLILRWLEKYHVVSYPFENPNHRPPHQDATNSSKLHISRCPSRIRSRSIGYAFAIAMPSQSHISLKRSFHVPLSGLILIV